MRQARRTRERQGDCLRPVPPFQPIVTPVSLFEVGVEDVRHADTVDAITGDSWTNFGMLGVVTHVEFTPFPNFLGYPAAIGGRYRNNAFEVLAGNVLGRHVTVARYAAGEFLAKAAVRGVLTRSLPDVKTAPPQLVDCPMVELEPA